MSNERRTLRDLVEAKGPFDAETAAQFVEQLSRELSGRHQLGQLHADFRPSVIAVDRTGTPRLMADSPNRISNYYFGQDEWSEFDACEIVGYLAPEQALGSARTDERTDVYCLGCLFYFMLTGRAPFEDGRISERLLKHQTTIPAAITQIQPNVPSALSDLCAKMLAKNPADRPQSAEKVVQAVIAWRGAR